MYSIYFGGGGRAGGGLIQIINWHFVKTVLDLNIIDRNDYILGNVFENRSKTILAF